MRKSLLSFPLIAATAATLLVAGPAFAATSTVTGANLGADWNTGDTRPGGTLAFTSEYGAPVGFGTGALQLVTTDSAAKVQMLTGQDAGVKLSDVKGSISYWAKQVAADPATPNQVASLNLFIDPDGPGTLYTYAPLILEPVYQPQTIVAGTWQKWDGSAATARWWSTRTFPGMTAFDPNDGPNIDAISAANPDATIRPEGYGFNQGSGNAGLTSAVDGLTIGSKTFDFGPRVYTGADCKNGGWATIFTPGTFKNQGACVSFYARGGTTPPQG
ncbi:MAG: hypothetical protein M3Y71_04260 [Actinomycetota bacterium]|nr:hypothetical protein [Actinomycetota bacterium]